MRPRTPAPQPRTTQIGHDFEGPPKDSTADDAIGRLDRSELIAMALGRSKGLRPMRADRLATLGLPQDRLTPEEHAELASTSRRTRSRSRTRR